MLRLPLAVEKIDAIDEIVRQGIGGFRDRHELITEAIDAYLLELQYGGAPDRSGANFEKATPPIIAASESRARNAGAGLLASVPECVTIDGGVEVHRAPLFGLHNRDYPSLWAAWQLAKMTEDHLVLQSEFLRHVATGAWKMGEQLRHLEKKHDGMKLAALFPTNSEKPESSEDAFKSFAIGSCALLNGVLRCGGPLFLWNVCAAEVQRGEMYLGLTQVGKHLLQQLEGISALIPHAPHFADAFVQHLQESAPEDWWGFSAVLKIAETNPTRDELLAHFRRERDHLGAKWTDHQIGSYATGYVSRCREWGILEPKLLQGRYYLTDYGTKLYVSSVTA